MSFHSKVLAFSSRFVSARSFELIVAPALADMEYEAGTTGATSAMGATDAMRAVTVRARIAVCRAVVGAMRIDLARNAGTFLFLSLVPACYYFVLMTVCFDFFAGKHGITGFFALAAPVLILSIAPVSVCFWPERGSALRSAE